MQTFQRVVERKSFSAVARELEMGQSAVSKQVAALEEHLGVQLLHRNTRELSLTDEGASYYRNCVRILSAVNDAEEVLGERRAEPAGILRIATSVAFARYRLIPLLKGLMDRYPRLEFELLLSDAMHDLIRDGIDVAVRLGNMVDSELIAQPLGMSCRLLVASRGYLDAYGTPGTLEELPGHRAVIFTGVTHPGEWSLMYKGELRKVHMQGAIRIDNAIGVRAAVLSNLGISLAPRWLFDEELADGRVQRVLPEVDPVPLPVQAVYAKSRHRLPKVRAFIEHLREHLPEAKT